MVHREASDVQRSAAVPGSRQCDAVTAQETGLKKPQKGQKAGGNKSKTDGCSFIVSDMC